MGFLTYTGSRYKRFKKLKLGLAQVVGLILFMYMFFFGHHQITFAETVHIPDPGLRAVLESALGKEAGDDITQTDMASLKTLEAVKSDVRDLTGLEFAIKLTGLHLGLNQISDISPLKNLTNLTFLDLHRNRNISDISSLKNLTNLTHLSLRGNRISDVSPLKDLAKLTYLHIGYNRISDVLPLKDLTELTFLNLDENQISDLLPLKFLKKLRRLELDDNKILDLSPLKDLTNLTFLNLNDNEISDLFSLRNLTNLTFLDIHGNAISDLSPLKNLTKLNVLRSHENRISNLSPLKNLTELSVLKLDDNQISDVSPLKILKNLKVLELSGNHISDFSPIAELIGNLSKYDNSNQMLPTYKREDVNRDGVVNITDIILAASNFDDPDLAALAQMNIYPDVNNDGVVDIRDLVIIASEIGQTSAPTLSKDSVKTFNLTVGNLTQWIRLAKQLDTRDPQTRKGIVVLEQLLVVLTLTQNLPRQTALLPSYPNPFNPETWIPYQLSKTAKVNIFIHSADGKLVRSLEIGQLPAGIYHSKSRAAYWDGRNELGESVANGIYFYTLTAGNFTATSKMFILK